MLNRSFTSELFWGLIRSRLACCECGERRDSYEPFSVLTLPIPKFLDMNFLFVKEGMTFELNFRISDRSTFFDLIDYARKFTELAGVPRDDVLATAVHNYQAVTKIFNPQDVVWRFKTVL